MTRRHTCSSLRIRGLIGGLRTAATANDLRAFRNGRVARFKIPATIYGAERFPLTASGKIRKCELRRLAGAGHVPQLMEEKSG